MAARHSFGTSNALFHVFVVPALNTQHIRPIAPAILRLATRTTPSRSFTLTTSHRARDSAPEVRKTKWDEEIQSPFVILVNKDGVKDARPTRLRTLLQTIDRKTTRVVQLSDHDPEDADSMPICRLTTLREIYERAKRKKQQEKAQRKVARLIEPKSLEINWAIDKHDLSRKMGLMKDFLAEGRRIEIVLAPKKRGRRATDDECHEVWRVVQESFESVPGAKVFKERNGKLGAYTTVMFQGKAPSISMASTTSPRDELDQS